MPHDVLKLRMDEMAREPPRGRTNIGAMRSAPHRALQKLMLDSRNETKSRKTLCLKAFGQRQLGRGLNSADHVGCSLYVPNWVDDLSLLGAILESREHADIRRSLIR